MLNTEGVAFLYCRTFCLQRLFEYSFFTIHNALTAKYLMRSETS